MGELTINAVRAQILGVLEEACLAPEKPYQYFNDPGARYSLFGLLEGLSSEAVNTTVRGYTIGQEVGHILYGMQAAAVFIRGEPSTGSWQESWRPRQLDNDAWSALLTDLQQAYSRLHRAIRDHAGDSNQALGAAIGAVAHIAYHLGEIRQLAAALEDGSSSGEG